MSFHISYNVTAQIRLYSTVQGNRYGLDFCTNMPTMFVREQGWEDAPRLILRRPVALKSTPVSFAASWSACSETTTHVPLGAGSLRR
jgi:hypothetical protein